MTKPRRSDSPRVLLSRLAVASVASLGLTASLVTHPPQAGGQPAPVEPAVAATGTAPADPPNVLLITVDDMEVSDLRRMPRLQRLVARGTQLTQAIAPTPICAPSRASILTGRYAHNHGVHAVSGPAGGFAALRDADTLPVWLQAAGYRTHFAGKYLNGYGDHDQRYVPPGWDDWYGAVGGSTYSFYRTRFNDDGRLVDTREHNSDVLAGHTVDLVEDAAGTTKPWFAWVNFTAPHHGGPAEPDDPRGVATTTPARRHRNVFRSARLPRVPEMLHSGGSPWAGAPVSRRRRAALREAYQQRAESLLSVDEAMGRIVAALRRTEQWEETYVVFTSDNGYLNGHHNRTGKLVPYDRSLRVPFYVVGPGVERGRSGTTATVVDLPVTIARLVGARPGPWVDGSSVVPALRGAPARWRPVPIAGWPADDGRRPGYVGVRVGVYTYVRRSGGGEVLFDRSRDPGELRNVARWATYRPELERMRELTRRYRDCRADTCRAVTPDPTP